MRGVLIAATLIWVAAAVSSLPPLQWTRVYGTDSTTEVPRPSPVNATPGSVELRYDSVVAIRSRYKACDGWPV